ncbi:unnamed protein product [Rhizopus stolonifer]
MNGYNSAGLYLSIGPNYLYDNRRQSHEMFLEMLKKAVKSSADPIQMEYVYLCITDDGCFDCRKDKWRPVSEEGIDLFMKGVSNVDDIWKKVQTEPKLPFVLKINLFNSTTKRCGNLFLVDLLHPKLLSHATSIHHSFVRLRDIIDTITMPNHRGRVSPNQYLLVDILAEFISGKSKSTVFTYLSEYPQKDFNEVVATLDLVQSLNSIQCISLPNERNPRNARKIENLQKENEELKKCLEISQNKYRTQLEQFKNNSSQLLELKTIQMQQKSLIYKAELGMLKSDMRKSKADSIVFGAASSFKDIQLFNIERENKRQKLDVESQAAIIEKYKVQTDRNEHMIEKYKAQAYKNKDIIEKYQAEAYKNEDIEKYKEEAQRFRKLAQQSQKETLNLHREYKVEIEKLKEGFKEKALSFKEEVRRRMAEFQNAS